MEVCKILSWCHGIYTCAQMAVSSLFLHTRLKMSKIDFSLHFPCAWGLNELILSFHVFIKIFCFYWNMFLIKNIISWLRVCFWNKYVYEASAQRRGSATHLRTGFLSLTSRLSWEKEPTSVHTNQSPILSHALILGFEELEMQLTSLIILYSWNVIIFWQTLSSIDSLWHFWIFSLFFQIYYLNIDIYGVAYLLLSCRLKFMRQVEDIPVIQLNQNW